MSVKATVGAAPRRAIQAPPPRVWLIFLSCPVRGAQRDAGRQRPAAVQLACPPAGIGHDVYYPKATHQQDPYLGPSYHLPVTEEMVERVLSIPVRPDLTDQEIEHIVETLNRAVA